MSDKQYDDNVVYIHQSKFDLSASDFIRHLDCLKRDILVRTSNPVKAIRCHCTHDFFSKITQHPEVLLSYNYYLEKPMCKYTVNRTSDCWLMFNGIEFIKGEQN